LSGGVTVVPYRLGGVFAPPLFADAWRRSQIASE